MRSWFLRNPQPEAVLRMYCFCHAGGNPSMFMPWQHHLGGAVEVCAVQLPGRGTRLAEHPPHEFDSLIAEVMNQLRVQKSLPYILFGHSLGALIAFEVARAMRRSNRSEPLRLFVSGCDAPQFRSPSMRLHELDDSLLIEAIAAYGGTSEALLAHRELMDLALPAIRADFALEADYLYRPEPPLNTPIVAFAGRNDDHVDSENVAEWARETCGHFSLEWFDGGHFFVETERLAVLKRIAGLL